jgi:hypothetical protein
VMPCSSPRSTPRQSGRTERGAASAWVSDGSCGARLTLKCDRIANRLRLGRVARLWFKRAKSLGHRTAARPIFGVFRKFMDRSMSLAAPENGMGWQSRSPAAQAADWPRLPQITRVGFGVQ